MEFKVSINDIFNIVPTFDGSPGDLNKFIACGNILFSSVDTDKHKTFLEIVKTRLQGAAFELTQFNSFTTWNELVKELESQFKQEKSRSSAQNELMSAKQGAKESVYEFGDRLAQLLSALNSATLGTVSEKPVRDFLTKENSKLALQTFEDNLRNHTLKILVKAHKADNLKNAVAYAVEQSFRLDKSPHHFSSPTGSTSNATRPICRTCNKVGHSSETCYQNTNRLPQFPSSVKREVQFLSCTFCQKPNHSFQNCRTRLAQARQNVLNEQNRGNINNYNNHNQNNYQNRNSNNHNQNQNHYQDQRTNPNRQINYHHIPDHQNPSNQSNEIGFQGNELSREENPGDPSRVNIQAEVHQARN